MAAQRPPPAPAPPVPEQGAQPDLPNICTGAPTPPRRARYAPRCARCARCAGVDLSLPEEELRRRFPNFPGVATALQVRFFRVYRFCLNPETTNTKTLEPEIKLKTINQNLETLETLEPGLLPGPGVA